MVMISLLHLPARQSPNFPLSVLFTFFLFFFHTNNWTAQSKCHVVNFGNLIPSATVLDSIENPGTPSLFCSDCIPMSLSLLTDEHFIHFKWIVITFTSGVSMIFPSTICLWCYRNRDEHCSLSVLLRIRPCSFIFVWKVNLFYLTLFFTQLIHVICLKGC